MRGFLALAALVLAACASIPGGELSSLDEPECIVISQRVSYRMEGRGRWGIGVERGLFPGIYRGVLRNSEGTLFEGDKRPIFFRGDRDPAGVYYLAAGGVWLPKNTENRPWFYGLNTGDIAGNKTSDIDLFERDHASAAQTIGGAEDIYSALPWLGPGGALVASGVESVIMPLFRGMRLLLWEISDETFTHLLRASLKSGAKAGICLSKAGSAASQSKRPGAD